MEGRKMSRIELRYVELKTGYSDNGPAWIGLVKYSKTGRTLYFNGRALKHIKRGGWAGNHEDLETGEEYWVSGIKKDGPDRHPQGGTGIIEIDRRVVSDFLALKGWNKLDTNWYRIIEIADTDPSKFYGLENGMLA
jgi:hypothetical protein